MRQQSIISEHGFLLGTQRRRGDCSETEVVIRLNPAEVRNPVGFELGFHAQQGGGVGHADSDKIGDSGIGTEVGRQMIQCVARLD